MQQQNGKARAVFLDRDGVINRAVVLNGKSYPPATVESFEILPGVHEALNRLKKAGFLTVVVTNQPDVTSGKQSLEAVEEIHRRLSRELQVDEIRVCIHVDSDCCSCRKPNPGMLVESALLNDIDLSQSYLIGDRWRDIEAGQRAGCRQCFFIDYDYSEKKPNSPYIKVRSLLEATEQIIGSER